MSICSFDIWLTATLPQPRNNWPFFTHCFNCLFRSRAQFTNGNNYKCDVTHKHLTKFKWVYHVRHRFQVAAAEKTTPWHVTRSIDHEMHILIYDAHLCRVDNLKWHKSKYIIWIDTFSEIHSKKWWKSFFREKIGMCEAIPKRKYFLEFLKFALLCNHSAMHRGACTLSSALHFVMTIIFIKLI